MRPVRAERNQMAEKMEDKFRLEEAFDQIELLLERLQDRDVSLEDSFAL